MNEQTMTNAESTTLAALGQQQNLSTEFATTAAGTGAVIRTSTTTDDVRLFNAVNGSAESVEVYLDKEVQITDIVVTSADVLKDINDDEETGERESKPVIHFFTVDGKHISSISNGISRAAKNLLSCGFIPTAERPFTIKFKTVKTKKGIAHSFDLISK